MTVPMALVKFSTTIAKVSHACVETDDGLPGERKVGDSLQDAADPETDRQRTGARHEPAGEAADQRCGKADALDDGRIFSARKAEIDHKRRRHGAGERIGELEQHDEGESDQGQVARKKLGKGADRRLDDTRQRVCPRMGRGGCADFSGSRAKSVVAMPTSTSAAITV